MRGIVATLFAVFVVLTMWYNWQAAQEDLAALPAESELQVFEGAVSDALLEPCAYRRHGSRGRLNCVSVMSITLDTGDLRLVVKADPRELGYALNTAEEWQALRGQPARFAMGAPCYHWGFDRCPFDVTVGETHPVQYAQVMREARRRPLVPLLFLGAFSAIALLVILFAPWPSATRQP